MVTFFCMFLCWDNLCILLFINMVVFSFIMLMKNFTTIVIQTWSW
jgi:hypothetical protein